MKFFQSIEQHLDGINLNIVLTKTKDGLTVSVLPKLICKDDTKKNIVPLMIKGTAEQLDEQFVTLIQKPLSEVSGFSTNLIEFEKAQEIAKEKSAITKAGKDAEVKMIKKADTCITKAEGFIEKDDIKKAILQIEAALKFFPAHKKAKELLATHKPGATGMFEAVEEVKEVPTDVTTDEAKTEMITKAEEVKEEPKVAVIEETPIAIEEETPIIETPVISIAKQEKVEANLDEEEVIGREIEEVVYDKVDADGKPTRQDMEPMVNYDERLVAFEAESPTVKADNPAATQPSDIEIEEVKSDMQEMTEQETADKEMEAMLEDVNKPSKAEVVEEPKEETPPAASDDKYEILG